MFGVKGPFANLFALRAAAGSQVRQDQDQTDQQSTSNHDGRLLLIDHPPGWLARFRVACQRGRIASLTAFPRFGVHASASAGEVGRKQRIRRGWDESAKGEQTQQIGRVGRSVDEERLARAVGGENRRQSQKPLMPEGDGDGGGGANWPPGAGQQLDGGGAHDGLGPQQRLREPQPVAGISSTSETRQANKR